MNVLSKSVTIDRKLNRLEKRQLISAMSYVPDKTSHISVGEYSFEYIRVEDLKQFVYKSNQWIELDYPDHHAEIDLIQLTERDNVEIPRALLEEIHRDIHHRYMSYDVYNEQPPEMCEFMQDIAYHLQK